MLKGVPVGCRNVRGPARCAGAGPQEPAETGGLEEVVVSAQKRTENLQDVPLSIQALGTAKIEELHLQNFQDYASFLPTLSFQNGGQSGGPGFSRAFMRGVASGETANHSGSAPSVGMYLDEQPVTTISGALDIHLYDIARVEALAGPQGTLYGASSQAGTIRIITNKPDPSGFEAGYDLEANSLAHGDQGYTGEGFANIPDLGQRRGTCRRLVSEGSRVHRQRPGHGDLRHCRRHARTMPPSSRRTTTTPRPTAAVRRCVSHSTTTGP